MLSQTRSLVFTAGLFWVFLILAIDYSYVKGTDSIDLGGSSVEIANSCDLTMMTTLVYLHFQYSLCYKWYLYSISQRRCRLREFYCMLLSVSCVLFFSKAFASRNRCCGRVLCALYNYCRGVVFKWFVLCSLCVARVRLPGRSICVLSLKVFAVLQTMYIFLWFVLTLWIWF